MYSVFAMHQCPLYVLAQIPLPKLTQNRPKPHGIKSVHTFYPWLRSVFLRVYYRRGVARPVSRLKECSQWRDLTNGTALNHVSSPSTIADASLKVPPLPLTKHTKRVLIHWHVCPLVVVVVIVVIVVHLLTPVEHRPSVESFHQIWYPLVLVVSVI